MAETDGQVERLEQVFASIDESPKGKTCDAIHGNHRRGQGNHGRVQGHAGP